MFFKNSDNKKSFDDSIQNNLNKLFLMDIYVTITSYKLLEPLKAVIIDYSKNILSLRFKDLSLVENFIIGDPIVINLTNEGILYSANATVLIRYNSTMDVKIEKVLSKNDNRKEDRFLVSFSGEMEFENNNTFIVLKNISKSGLNFLSKVDLPLNSKVKITFTTYDFTKISCIVSIIHKNSLIDGFTYGAFIVNMDANNLKKLNICLQKLI